MVAAVIAGSSGRCNGMRQVADHDDLIFYVLKRRERTREFERTLGFGGPVGHYGAVWNEAKT